MVIKDMELKMDKLPSDTTIPAERNKLSNAKDQCIRSNSTNESGHEGGDQSATGESADVENDLINRISDIHLSDQTPATTDSQCSQRKTQLLAPKPKTKEEDKQHNARSPCNGIPTQQSPQQSQTIPQSHGQRSGSKRVGDYNCDYNQYSATMSSADTLENVSKALKPTREPVEDIDPTIQSYPAYQQALDHQFNCNPYSNQQQQLSPIASSPASSYASYPTPPHTYGLQLPQNVIDYSYSQSYQSQPHMGSPPYQSSYASSSPGQSSLSQGPGSVESNYMYEAANSPLKQANDQLINDTLDVAQKVFGESCTNNESFQTITSPSSTYQMLQSPQSTTNTLYRPYPPELMSPSNSSQSSYDIYGNTYSPPMSSCGTAAVSSPPHAYAMPPTVMGDYRQVVYNPPTAFPPPQQTRFTHVPPQPAYYQQGMRYQTCVGAPQLQQQYRTPMTVQSTNTAVPVSATMSVGLAQPDAYHQYRSSGAPPPYAEYPVTNGPAPNAVVGLTPDLPNLGADVFQGIPTDTPLNVNEDGKIKIEPLKKPEPPKPAPPVPIPVTFSVIVLAAPAQIAKPATTTYREIKPNPKQAQELANQPSNEEKQRTKKGRKPGSKSKSKNVPSELAKTFIAGCSDDKLLSSRDNGHTFLTLAIAEGPSMRVNVVALLDAARTRTRLRELFAKRNEINNQSPLFLAVLTGQTWLVQKLVEFGVDDDQCSLLRKSDGSYEGYTALQYACKYGSRCLDSLKFLLWSKKIANSINMPNRDGMTALQLAIYHHKDIDPKDPKDPKGPTNNMEAIKCLLRHESINLNIQDNKSGKTSLHLAVDRGDLEMVKLIADAGAVIDAANYDGRTSLHLAASLRRSEQMKLSICQYLLQKGASKRLKDKSKEVPRSLVPLNELQLIDLLGDDMGGVVSLSPISTDLFS